MSEQENKRRRIYDLLYTKNEPKNVLSKLMQNKENIFIKERTF